MEPPQFYKCENPSFVERRLRLPKTLMKQWKEKVGWLYSFPWRSEQLEILLKFQQDDWDKFVIQAIFGGGKTTMILAMIHDLILQEKVFGVDEIMICAFNVAIKNEIKKKLKYLGKFIPRTFDSIVWHICKDLEYPDLKKPNFLEKRKFLYQNIHLIPPCHNIKYIFLDEAQDLEKNVEFIFFKRYPNARFIIVGDIFQSIQKEPRESFLWSLLQKQLPNTFNMTNTPRVPIPILKEMKESLYSYYPEFTDTIQQWTSSNTDSTLDKGIEWSMFSSYGDVFRKMENFVNHYSIEKSMILVFSSAVTVRGTLGDVSRVRRHFLQKKYSVNSSHKLMKDDSLFISTVNSSKGLERDHVFVFLTFPLELAFSNFSNDILMNLLTVGISRCKKTIHFCIPSYKDRFSPILTNYNDCPVPRLIKKNEKSKDEKKQLLNEHQFKLMPYMLEKEHSITEILRLQMISYSTRELMISYSKKYNETVIPSNIITTRTEEEATLLGLVFETLILSSWKNQWMNEIKSVGMSGHDMYDSFSISIKQLFHEWTLFKRIHSSFVNCSDEQKVNGAILYSKLQLAFTQKVFCRLSNDMIQNVLIRWRQLKHLIHQIKPQHTNKIDTQHSVRLPYMNGIVDVFYNPDNDLMEIFEIKASKQRDWLENALLQSIFYGLCKKTSFFRIHLINVFSGKWNHYYINFKKDLNLVLKHIVNDLQLYNLNCYLSKNRTIHSPIKKNFYIENVYFLDGIFTNEWKSLELNEFSSPTKITTLFSCEGKENIINFFENKLPMFIKDLHFKKIIVGRKLWKDCFPDFKNNIDVRFLNNTNKPFSENDWEQYLIHTNWYKEKVEIVEDESRTNINWNSVVSSMSIQICDLCNQFNFVM